MIEDENPQVISDTPMAANDLASALMMHDQGMLKALDICFPACVYSFDRTTHEVEVMPLVKMGFFNGEWNYIRRKPFRTTLRTIQCGGYTIDFPVYIGDTGWVFSSDRDTLLLKANGSLTNSVLAKDRAIAIVEDDYQQKPNQPKLHSFADGFFLPDNWGTWEKNRLKDDFGVSVGDALYIGSSIDTKDEQESSDNKEFQEGDEYETKTTSSIVLQKSGGVFLLSSTKEKDKEDDKNKGADEDTSIMKGHSKVYAAGDIAEMSASSLQEDNQTFSSISIGAQYGIVIRQDKPKDKKHFIATVDDNKFAIRLTDVEAKNFVNISFSEGNLNIMTSGKINVTALDDINVKSKKNAYVSSENSRVVVQKKATVAAETVNASATSEINLAAGSSIKLSAPDNINIITASNTSIIAKKKGASINVTTMSKGSTINVTSQGNDADILVSSEKSKVNVNAGKSVTVKGAESVSLSGKTVAVNGQPLIYNEKKGCWT